MRHRHLSSMLGLIGLAVLGAPTVGSACMPALPGATPETPEGLAARLLGYEVERQQALWRQADHIFLARVQDPLDLLEEERLSPPPPRRTRSEVPPVPAPTLVAAHMLGEGKTVVVLEPAAALKGSVPARRFRLRDVEGWTSCGPLRQFDVFYGWDHPDGLYVVFLSGVYPTQDGILEALSVENVVDPQLKAALQAQAATR